MKLERVRPSGAMAAAALFCISVIAGEEKGPSERGGFSLPPLESLGLERPAAVEQNSGSSPRSLIPPAQPAIEVKGFHYEGSTIFTSAELDEVTLPFLSKHRLTSDDLEAVRAAITQHYLNHGYVTSGALLPDQPVQDGIITFKIIEGRAIRIDWKNHRGLRERYLNRQMPGATTKVLNMKELRERLELLQRNPNIRRLNAQVLPDLRLGESFIRVDVERYQALRTGIDVHNRRPPSIGSEQIEAWITHTNVTGNSDSIELRAGLLQRGLDDAKFTEGDDLYARYATELPFLKTRIDVSWERNSYAVIEEPFTPLGIEGRSQAERASLSWALERRLEEEFIVGFSFDHRGSETNVLGLPFSLTPGSVDGEAEVTAVRAFQEYINRSRKSVLALRSTLSLGIEGTDDGTKRDADFVSWSLFGQWVRRIRESEATLSLRGGGQWSNDPLLAFEQIAIGGAGTVRGYRENQLVRDWGGYLSAELHLPVWKSRRGRWSLTLIPFVDAGGGWMLEETNGEWKPGRFDCIASAGIGTALQLSRFCEAQIFWGHPLRARRKGGGDDWQDNGIHFTLRMKWD